MPGTAAVIGASDSRLWLLTPARGLAQLLTKWKDLQVDLGLFGSGTLTVTIHQSHVDASYSGDDAIATDFGWTGTQGLWSLDYYHRGTRVFSGPVQNVTKTRDGGDGTAYVTITAEMWLPALLRRRQVRTSTGAPFVVNDDSWHDIACELVRNQCDPDDIVTPTGWQQNSETRDDFGAFVVEVAADDASGDEYDHSVPVRTNLWDAVCEVCIMSDDGTDGMLWPTVTESPAGTFTVNFLVGRSGGSRAIGSNLVSSVIFSSLHGNLLAFELERDGVGTENHLVSGGAGPGTSQSTRHAADDTSITTRNLGVYEGVEDVPGGFTTYEQDNHLRRALFERKNIKQWRAVITETADLQWPADFDIKDSITIYDSAFGETVSDMIIGVRLTYPAPGPYRLELVFGQPPRNELRSIGRSGGGGGGGRGGGGAGRNNDGKRYVYEHIVDDSLTESQAHEQETGLKIYGVDGNNEVEVKTTISDQTAAGSDDAMLLEVQCTPVVADPTANRVVPIKVAGGGTVYLLATTVSP